MGSGTKAWSCATMSRAFWRCRVEAAAEIVLEEAPVGDHEANCSIEDAMNNLQGQLRVLKDALESRLGGRIAEEHVIVPWLVTHAGSVINRSRADKVWLLAVPSVEGETQHQTGRGVR